MDIDINEKILNYENFVNDVLKEDLKVVHEQWDKIITELNEWMELKNVIKTMNDMDVEDDFKTLMDIGANVYVQTNIPDISKIFINIGCGVYIEFEQDEALRCIEKRIKLLIEQSRIVKTNSAKIKARIKLVLHGIQELSKIK